MGESPILEFQKCAVHHTIRNTEYGIWNRGDIRIHTGSYAPPFPTASSISIPSIPALAPSTPASTKETSPSLSQIHDHAHAHALPRARDRARARVPPLSLTLVDVGTFPATSASAARATTCARIVRPRATTLPGVATRLRAYPRTRTIPAPSESISLRGEE
ncbi:hypothetical protein FRB91_001599 [Serendipita sp. 411]|nr:hypothetical protein FRB91_001599 [Serendipita sp. 411]